jgi:fumarate hydratase class I
MAPEFSYQDLLPIGEDKTEYRLLSSDGIATFSADGKEFLKVSPAVIENLTEVALHDISHYLRSEHLAQLANILKDPESSPNDRFVALDLLKNANISAGGVLPMCQDTGTVIVMGKKGQQILTTEKDVLLSKKLLEDRVRKLFSGVILKHHNLDKLFKTSMVSIPDELLEKTQRDAYFKEEYENGIDI